MADNFKFAQLQPFTLAGAGAILGDTTIILTTMTGIDGASLSMSSDFGTIGYGTLEPGTSTQEEQISFTGLTNNSNGTTTLTGVKSVLFVYPYTETSGLAKTHAGGTTFVISNTSGFYDKLTSKSDDETITGLWDFPSGASNPTIGNVTYVAPTGDTQIATKKYIDDIAIAGSPNATLTVKGIVEIATTAEIDAGTSTGGTGASIVARPDQLAASIYNTQLPSSGQKLALVGDNTDIAVGTGNKYVTQTGLQKGSEVYGATATGNDTYVVTLSPIPTSYDNGRHYFVKVDVGNTGAATINFNSLGAIAIVTGVSTALVTGDILANQIIELIYNSTGTVFQLVNPASAYLSTPVYANGTATKDASDASTTQNIAHGLGKIPKTITISALSAGVNNGWTGVARTTYSGSTQSSISTYNTGVGTATQAATFTLNTAVSASTQTGVVTIDATNIIITWTKSGSPTGTYQLLWTAQA